MSNILKHLGRESSLDPDLQDRMADLEGWNESVARKIAAEQDLELNEDHWDVIHFLRRHYLEHGSVTHARQLTEILGEYYAKKGGGKFLYDLFPNGPVAQGCKLAGLPAISDSTNSSFGSVQ